MIAQSAKFDRSDGQARRGQRAQVARTYTRRGKAMPRRQLKPWQAECAFCPRIIDMRRPVVGRVDCQWACSACGQIHAAIRLSPSIEADRNPPRPVTVYVPCD